MAPSPNAAQFLFIAAPNRCWVEDARPVGEIPSLCRADRILLDIGIELCILTDIFSFSPIIIAIQAVIAARAARDRTLTVLLVAMWGRLARMGTRLERLIALWRAGKLPAPHKPRLDQTETRDRKPGTRPSYPSAPGWLFRELGYAVGPYGVRLRELLTEAECVEFLAEVPQAGRILRPLLRMLSFDPLPEVICREPRPAYGLLAPAPMAKEACVLPLPGMQFSAA